MVYRSKAEMDEWKGRDPGRRCSALRLLGEAGIAEAEVVALEKDVQALLDEAVAFAAPARSPQPETALAGVYGETHGGLAF